MKLGQAESRLTPLSDVLEKQPTRVHEATPNRPKIIFFLVAKSEQLGDIEAWLSLGFFVAAKLTLLLTPIASFIQLRFPRLRIAVRFGSRKFIFGFIQLHLHPRHFSRFSHFNSRNVSVSWRKCFHIFPSLLRKPQNKPKQQTKKQKKSFSPSWNEIFHDSSRLRAIAESKSQ